MNPVWKNAASEPNHMQYLSTGKGHFLKVKAFQEGGGGSYLGI